ncbi:carbohydrate kinase family protein [Brevibacillus sp. NRS-1366]|uniref:carbohydrate kinase family protein n=1 Tax=Brevibacillus sp. NRS-1366 TaxID=3233899 RepID=UPI003D22CFE7
MLEGMSEYWLCVGGANVDVQGVTHARLLPGTSNPGHVQQAAGGVARNVAENLGWLGQEVQLFALVGEDPDGEWLRQTTAKSGVATHGMFLIPGKSTGRYLAIRDLDGELYSGVADMDVNDAWTETLVQSTLRRFPQAAGLFMDANLPQAVMQQFLDEAKRLDKMVIVDPVSVKKAEKWRGMLDGVHLLISSIDEIETLSGQSLYSFYDVERCARKLVDEGIRQIMVNCGDAGICLCDQKDSIWMQAPPNPIRETAGDAFAAGVIYAQNKASSLVEQAAYGIALAELSGKQKGMYDIEQFLQRKEFYATSQLQIGDRERG